MFQISEFFMILLFLREEASCISDTPIPISLSAATLFFCRKLKPAILLQLLANIEVFHWRLIFEKHYGENSKSPNFEPLYFESSMSLAGGEKNQQFASKDENT